MWWKATAAPIALVLQRLAAVASPWNAAVALEDRAAADEAHAPEQPCSARVTLPWADCRIEQSRFFAVRKSFEPIFAFSLGLLVLSLGYLTHANLYLAAFAAGITIVTLRADLRDEFHQFGEIVAELLKLAALLVFGVLMSPQFFAEVPPAGYVFAALALFAVRPVAIAIAMLRSGLDWREQITAGWFGPKGFASSGLSSHR